MMAGIIDYLDAYDRLTQECRTRPHPRLRRARARLKSTIMRKWMGTKAKAKNRGERISELEADVEQRAKTLELRNSQVTLQRSRIKAYEETVARLESRLEEEQTA